MTPAEHEAIQSMAAAALRQAGAESATRTVDVGELERRACASITIPQAVLTLLRLRMPEEARALTQAQDALEAGAPLGIHKSLDSLRDSAALAILMARSTHRLRLLR